MTALDNNTAAVHRKPALSKFSVVVLIVLTVLIIVYTKDWDPAQAYTILYYKKKFQKSANVSAASTDLNNNSKQFENEAATFNNFTTTKYILDWTGFFSSKLADSGWLRHCPDYNCQVIDDRAVLNTSDAVAFHMRNFKLTDLPTTRRADQYFLFYLLESPYHTYVNLHAIRSYFNVTVTYRHDSDFVLPYGSISPKDEMVNSSFLGTLRNLVAKKSKMVAWFVSNCNTPSKREKYVNALKKYIPVDVYGSCSPQKCPHGPHCDTLLERDYKFYLSFENSLCKDYVTEKLFSRLAQMVVPIILSRQYYEHVNLPEKSVIVADEFCSVEHLAKYLTYLNKNVTAYLEYFEWKTKFQVNDFICADKRECGFCGLCKMLHDSKRPKRILDNAYKWWYDDAHCDSDLVSSLLKKKCNDNG